MRWRMILGGIVLCGVAVGWGLTRPAALPESYGAGLTGDASAGALVFAAAGCGSCHAGTDGAVLAGGKALVSPFGTFHAPNISPDPTAGIGAWSLDDFARAVTLGVSPTGQHYYPAFPYAAYQDMAEQDVVDLFAHMRTLPANARPDTGHDLAFPFTIRRGVGLWKRAFAPAGPVVVAGNDPVLQRGRYLAEALAHCGECHTPRNALGGLVRARWMAGAPNPSGTGRIPGITPATLDWSAADLMAYFTSGFTPDYDSAGGQMAEVVENLALLPDADRAAIVAYVQALDPAE